MLQMKQYFYETALVIYEWFFHRHVYRGPREIGYHEILRDTYGNYVCDCGAKIKVLHQGEILLAWDKRGDIIFNSLRSSVGGLCRPRKFINNYNANITSEIKEEDIDAL